MDSKTVIGARDLIESGFSRYAAYKLLSDPNMPCIRIGRRKFLHRALFEAMLRERAISSQEIAEQSTLDKG